MRRAILTALLLAGIAHAEPPPPRTWVPNWFDPAAGYCWADVRVFESLRHGPFEYCRQKLKYTPGKPECFQITDQVCVSLLPNGLWGDARANVVRQRFVCPRAPEPPVCRRLDFS
jgi:hypothetical protein